MKLRIFIYIVSILPLFSFAQKKYSFNLYTIYELKNNSSPNTTLEIVYNDTLNENYKLSFSAKNDFVIRVSLNDITKQKIDQYNFDIKNIKFQSINYSKDFKQFSKNSFPFSNKSLQKICDRNKYYDRKLEQVNDSIEKETFNFYNDKKKMKKKVELVIESYSNKHIINDVPDDYIYIIGECIDQKYKSKIVTKMNSIYFSEDGTKKEYNLKLIEMNTANISINLH